VGIEQRRHDEMQQRPQLWPVSSARKRSLSSSPCIEFWIGVPVRSSLFRQLKESSDFHRIDEDDLIACASSKIIYCQRIVARYDASITAWRELCVQM